MKKILMVTMSMDIGGAETHILELSAELIKRGFEVFIASNGGSYISKIKEYGIKHVDVPLNNKKVSNIIKSKKILQKLIIDEKIDVVHAHARIPMYVCGLIKKSLGKKQKFAYVTTDHANFRKNFIWKILTNWGEKTLAISQDLKESLINDYGVDAKDIKLTVNGINSEVFNKNILAPSHLDIYEKCSGKFNILHVSRLSEEASVPVYALIRNIEKLLQVNKDINIIIIGDGVEFDKIKKEANLKNLALGREVIYVLGRKTNVNEYIAFSDMMVAISRSALEGMSSEKPVFLAGPYGILGELTEKNIDIGLSDNFTCRNADDYDEAKFIEELVKYIITYLEDEGQIIKSVSYAKEMLTKNYSVQRMADDALSIYQEAYDKINAVIFGYIGFDNSGDDAIFDLLSSSLLKRYKGMNLTAISSSSKKTIMNDEIKRVYSFSFLKILKELKKSDIVIANGGSLLQDSTSSRSLLYYLWIINTAKKYKKHVCMIANGLGPINLEKNRKRVQQSLDKVDLITYRDHKSKNLSDQLNITKPEIHTTADLVFSFSNDDEKNITDKLFDNLKMPKENILGVSIRPWKNSDIFSLQMAQVCDKIIRELGVNIIFIPFQKTKRVDDMEAIKDVVEKMQEKPYVLEEILNYKELAFIISKMDAMIAMRLHSAIYALVNKVPVYGLSYQPKVKVYLEKFNLPYTEDLNQLDENEILQAVKDLLIDKEEVSKKIGENLSELSKKADENINILCDYIDRNIVK